MGEEEEMREIFFYLFAFLSVAFAVISVTHRNVIKGGIALLSSFVSLGAVYFTAGAEFIGIVQVIVYGGAIVVLYLFALMTMNLKSFGKEPLRTLSLAVGGAVSLVLLVSVLYAGYKFYGGAVTAGISGAKEIALPLFYRFLLPFEVVSVLLLVATVGAVAVGRREE